MPTYLLSVCYPPGGSLPSDEQMQRIMADVSAFQEELQREGAWVFSGGLHDPSTATTVRIKDGETLTTDGPFIESKEILGGLTIIEASDLDAALAWAEKAARATTTPIEVRPFQSSDNP